jgi:DedD protein
MPFFNFRRGGSNTAPNAGSAAQTESVEVMRKRAKHRLIGSAVLVLIGVVGFPLLFDTQPRPIPVDIPIEIPGKRHGQAAGGAGRRRNPDGNARPVPKPDAG